MRNAAAVSEALNALERIQTELAAVSSRTDERRKYDLIELRRELAAQIATVGQLVEPLLIALDLPDELQLFREKFSQMRSAAALHQANWPAVRLDEADDTYSLSVRQVRERNRDFVAWMRSAMARI
ncbi:hypothetical protein P6144_05165 [Sphingomonas sp. HITSZ_GF]|uniref:hypothetical protein n=1 Tax=Sphingomonas sp. HITSZ_GF TaxID=3037247 RepID=UPI00240E3B3D|nr:hypothetical protein [Sphingomonas sp. HITSZ_GF]MDG2533026.1 hypothetical protein [Sphingomonas sp. HITSZ_GF]